MNIVRCRPVLKRLICFVYMLRVWYEGELTYVPVTETYPAASYWGIDATSSTYGTYTVVPSSTAGIVDTGTTRMFASSLLRAPH